MAFSRARIFWSKVQGLMEWRQQSRDLGLEVQSQMVVDQPLTLKMPRKISSADLDECARVLGSTRALLSCLRNNDLRGAYLATADASILDALPGAIDFFRALSCDLDDYLSTTSYSHDWLRDHGHGD
jgi:hypothetical protein